MEIMSEAMREAYRDTVATLTYIRSQRWIVTNYTLAGFGAVVALSKFGGRDLPLSKREFLTGIVGLIALLGLTILTSYTADISQTRKRLRFAHLTYFTDEERKGFALDIDNTSFWHDPVLTISFYGAMIAGFILAFDVLLPEISPI
jgi:hypothetical protein